VTEVAPIVTAPTAPILEPGEIQITPTATLQALEANKPKMVRVKLLRNYRPMGEVEIAGHWKPEIIVRNKLGKDEVISPAEFIEGENAPPPQAGVGFKDKLWAGTVIRLPVDEAKRAQKLAIAELEIDD
jgi:hypothetical protein